MFCGETSRCTEELVLLVAQLVRCVEAGQRVEQDAQGNRLGQALTLRGCAGQEAGQRVPLHVLHHEEVAVLARADVEDGDHVGVVNARGEACLVHEHVDELLLAGQVRMQALDRDEALEAAHAADSPEEDRGHATRRELADEFVTIEPLAHVEELDGGQVKTSLSRLR